MCGIFAIFNSSNINNEIKNLFIKGKKRGPENSKLNKYFIKTILGFHRLAINGLNEEANQPLIMNNYILICNGEIYNHTQLYNMMNIIPKTESDCEVIIHLYKKYGIKQTLEMLDGVFAFVLIDKETNSAYVARDIYGVRPLFIGTRDEQIGIASELKMLSPYFKDIMPFKPGTYSYFTLENNWECSIRKQPLFCWLYN